MSTQKVPATQKRQAKPGDTQNAVEDLEDIRIAEQTLERIRRGKERTYTSDEVEKLLTPISRRFERTRVFAKSRFSKS